MKLIYSKDKSADNDYEHCNYFQRTMEDYNDHRPHDPLDGRSPMDMLAVDSRKTPGELPTNPQPITTMTINEIV